MWKRRMEWRYGRNTSFTFKFKRSYFTSWYKLRSFTSVLFAQENYKAWGRNSGHRTKKVRGGCIMRSCKLCTLRQILLEGLDQRGRDCGACSTHDMHHKEAWRETLGWIFVAKYGVCWRGLSITAMNLRTLKGGDIIYKVGDCQILSNVSACNWFRYVTVGCLLVHAVFIWDPPGFSCLICQDIQVWN